MSAAIPNKAGVSNYLSLVTFSHTIFALPFAIIGFFLAVERTEHEFSWYKFGLMILCMVFARSAAMGFNRYVDRDIDAKNERTVSREIPAGIISGKSALIFVIINCVLFIASTWFINSMCFYLSPIALAVVLGYSYTKRFTALCHVILGIGLALAPIGAWLAVTGEFNWLPLGFSFAVLFWVSGFDMIYALQDQEFDKKNKLHSIPAAIGKKNALALSRAFHIVSASLIWTTGVLGGFGIYYLFGAILFSVLLWYQHTLVKPDDLSKVNRAFFTTNGIASVAFAILVICDLYFVL